MRQWGNMKQFSRVLLCAISIFFVHSNANSATVLYTELFSFGSVGVGEGDILVEMLAGASGKQIKILKLGIGGDADQGSGPIGFRAIGGGVDFTWAAGQETHFGSDIPTYKLAPTPETVSSGRGFSYSGDLSLVLNEGAGLEIYSDFRRDFDGRYTIGSDLLGNNYDDSAVPSSFRPWVLYEYVDVAAVPEPATWLMMISGFAVIAATMRLRAKKPVFSR
jgi:hypothetical protein